MNKDLRAIAKFKKIATIIQFLFFILTIILIPVFAYLFHNYWLFFGVAFSFFGAVGIDTVLEKVFGLLTIVIIIYWYNQGFVFSNPETFFWFSYLFGHVFFNFSKGFDNLAQRIGDNIASVMTSTFIDGLKARENVKQ